MIINVKNNTINSGPSAGQNRRLASEGAGTKIDGESQIYFDLLIVELERDIKDKGVFIARKSNY